MISSAINTMMILVESGPSMSLMFMITSKISSKINLKNNIRNHLFDSEVDVKGEEQSDITKRHQYKIEIIPHVHGEVSFPNDLELKKFLDNELIN